MSDAKKILDERLAKGEITKTEYADLLDTLGASVSEKEPPSPKASEVKLEKLNDISEKPEFEKAAKFVGGAVGFYLFACIILAFIGVKDIAAEGVYEVCTDRSSNFCRCQANAARNHASFFNAPLVLAGLSSTPSFSAGCQHTK